MNRLQHYRFSRTLASLLATTLTISLVSALAAALPKETQGVCPIEQPIYEGQVKQMLLIDNRRLVLIVYDLPIVIEKLDELAGGGLKEINQQIGNWPDWRINQEIGKLHQTYMVAAREACGERKLDETNAYALTSKTAPASPIAPKNVARTIISLGDKKVPNAHSIDYAQYCFLEFSEPMTAGKTYTVAVNGRGSATFTFSEKHSLSRAIKVNQVGYLPNSNSKFAYLGAYGLAYGPLEFPQAKSFSIVDAATGQSVFTGEVVLRERNPRFTLKEPSKEDAHPTERPPLYGEHVYELGFTPFKTEGVFFISIPGVGRSWPFRHARDAYGEAFYITLRGLYHQRCGTGIDAKFSSWTRPVAHSHTTVYECEFVNLPLSSKVKPSGRYDRFDIIGATTDTAQKTENVIGGWHDAADWDRNLSHYTVIFDLLHAFEAAPKAFTDGQLHIPESGNGIPDILDEARWGLECWRRSQTKNGGVSGFIETWTHPPYDIPEFKYAFSRRTTWDSLIYAAAAAQYAQLVSPYSKEDATLFANSALLAWKFGTDPANVLGEVTFNAKTKRGQGEPYTTRWTEHDTDSIPYRVHAAMMLYRLTGDIRFRDDAIKYEPQMDSPMTHPFSNRDYSAWMPLEFARNRKGDLPPEAVARRRDYYIKTADQYVENWKQMPYRMSWPRYQDYWGSWGASTMPNFNRVLAVAYQLTGETKYRDVMINNIDFSLGANPKGMSWTTGLGYVYPVEIQHDISKDDGIPDPVPGITIYGITGAPGMHHRGRELAWASKAPDGELVSFVQEDNRSASPFFRSFSTHPAYNTGQCEFTVAETMACLAFTSAYLLEPGWMPDEDLKQRQPRDESLLFGRWPLQ